MAAGWKRQRSRESTSARVPRWREAERGDFSGHPERHEAAEFPCFVSMLKAVFSFMNMHIWNLSRRNSRLLAGVLIESSCQLRAKECLNGGYCSAGVVSQNSGRGGRVWRCGSSEMSNTRSSREKPFFIFYFELEGHFPLRGDRREPK